MTRKTRSGRDCSRVREHSLQAPAFLRHEPLPEATAPGTVFHRLLLNLRQAARFEVRTGYQDRTGFHLGVQPAGNEIQWPPLW